MKRRTWSFCGALAVALISFAAVTLFGRSKQTVKSVDMAAVPTAITPASTAPAKPEDIRTETFGVKGMS